MTHRVLVVDDEPDIREIARLSLERLAGWTVLTASNGVEAAEVARTESVDAVLLDVMMPGTDGPSTVSMLRAEQATAQLPIVLLTAKAQASDRQRLAELDVAGVIQKPFDPRTLADQIASLLHWRHDDGPTP